MKTDWIKKLADFKPEIEGMPTVNWHVFNQTAEEHRAALGAVGKELGGLAEREILEADKRGIMSIFNRPPTQATACYVLHIATAVESRSAKAKGSQ